MNYWEKRYQKGETGWDAGQITTPIKEYIDQLTNKNLKILIRPQPFAFTKVAMEKYGLGHQERGFFI